MSKKKKNNAVEGDDELGASKTGYLGEPLIAKE